MLAVMISSLPTSYVLAEEKPLPDWYRQGTTLGDTLIDSKMELTRRTLKIWKDAGFAESLTRPLPKFIKTAETAWTWDEIKDERTRTFEFDVSGLLQVYVGSIDRFSGGPFNNQCRLWTVDSDGFRTPIDLGNPADRDVTLQQKSIHNHPAVYEYSISLPLGTEQLIIENIQSTEPFAVGWVDSRSRIEMIAETLEPFGQLARMIDEKIRRDPQTSRAGGREKDHARICCGPYTDFPNMIRRYCWNLPQGQRDLVDSFVKDRSKVDRQTLLKARDAYTQYHAVIEPKMREYREIRISSQIREFHELIEATEGVPRSKALLPNLAKMRETASDIERDINEVRTTSFASADRMVTELTKIKTIFEVECRLQLASRTLDYVQKSKKLPEEAKQLAQLAAKTAKAGQDDLPELLSEIKSLRRTIILQHPDLQFKKLLICKNPPPGPGHMCDQYLGRHAREGKGLFVVEDWLTDEPKETCITEDLPKGYYHHPDLSFDGKRVAFAFCDITTPDKLQRRHWIYEATIDGSSVRQLTGTIDDPMERFEGRKSVVIEDWDPCYLPNGQIAFVSTRTQSYGRCHGGRYVPAFLLYTMNPDGSDIRRASFGEANEWDPAVLPDGRIVYTRWDYINRHDTKYQGLWTTYPDGTRTAHYYGSYSASPCMIADTQPIPGTNKVVSTAMAHHGYTRGSIIIVDGSQGEDGWEPLQTLTPDIPFPEASYDPLHFMKKMPQPIFDAQSKTGLKSRASAMAPYPINDTLFLCSYNGHGGYHTYLVDTLGGRELIYDKDQVSAAIPILPRAVPRVMPSVLAKNPTADTGTLVIQDVYQNRHVVEQRPVEPGSIKSLRVNLILTQPTRNHFSRGSVSNEVIKRPLGTVPVNPDGSVALTVPAGLPLQLQTLDENGLAVMTMRSFIYLHPGETQTCVGCHEQRSSSPISFPSMPATVHRLRPTPGVDYDNEAMSFTRTVQPVLDRYCISCHGLGETTADGRRAPRNYIFSVKLDENRGDKRFDAMPSSYSELVRAAGPRLAHRNGETPTSVPRDYFAATSKLPKMLLEGHNGLNIDADSFERIVTWLDLNSQCYGTYLPNRQEQREADRAGEAALRAYVKQIFGEELAAQPLGALVNPTNLEESRILKGPLADKAGGWATIPDGFASTKDPKYIKMRELASSVYQPLPFENIDGTCGREKCICGNCWIRDMVDGDVYREQLKEQLEAATLETQPQ